MSLRKLLRNPRSLLYLLPALLVALLVVLSSPHASRLTPLAFRPVTAAPVGEGGAILLADRTYVETLLQRIDQAKREIAVGMFSFKTSEKGKTLPDQIVDAFIRAARRGVRVEVLLEGNTHHAPEVNLDNQATAARLKKGGVTVRFDTPKKTTHTKVVVIDRRWVFLGSHNWTTAALRHNHETSLLVDSPVLAEEALRYLRGIEGGITP